jgi:hypothetical protein
MNRRRSLLIAAVAITTTSLAWPTSAQAADAGDIIVSGGAASPTALAGVAGDTFEIRNQTAGSVILQNGSGQFNKGPTSCATLWSPCSLFAGVPGVYTVVGEGSALLYEWNGTSTGALIATIFINASGSDSSASNSGSTPPALIQQFGKPAAGTCDAVASPSLNWSGVASGGWGESWSEWMNDGKGGSVCTRTLVYSTNQSKWIVG